MGYTHTLTLQIAPSMSVTLPARPFHRYLSQEPGSPRPSSGSGSTAAHSVPGPAASAPAPKGPPQSRREQCLRASVLTAGPCFAAVSTTGSWLSYPPCSSLSVAPLNVRPAFYFSAYSGAAWWRGVGKNRVHGSTFRAPAPWWMQTSGGFAYWNGTWVLCPHLLCWKHFLTSCLL